MIPFKLVNVYFKNTIVLLLYQSHAFCGSDV